MAPPKSRKRKSDEMEQPPQAVTPTGSPARKRMKITQTQKQALIDNLQLEITERARHLRAHYALQCADLQARIQRRVNRIPIAMRKMTMAELAATYEEIEKPKSPSKTLTPAKKQFTSKSDLDRPLPAVPSNEVTKMTSPARMQTQSTATRIRNKQTQEVNISSDKENETYQTLDALAMPKNNKRVKTVASTRATSRTGKPNTVLSPRSHNSRTLPRSPAKEYNTNQTSPAKSFISRPTSPLKPASPLKTAASAASSAFHGMIEQAKRGTGAAAGKLSRTTSREKATAPSKRGKMLPPPRPTPATTSSPQRVTSQASNHSSTSEQSTDSTDTTVVTKSKRGRITKATVSNITSSEDEAGRPTIGKTVRKGTIKASNSSSTTVTGGSPKKVNSTTNKKVVVAEPATGRRVLRKRN